VVKRADLTLTIALCASLVVHGAIATGLTAQYARYLSKIYLTGTGRDSIGSSVAVEPEDPFGKERGAGDAIADFKSDRTLMGREGPVPQAFLSRDARGFGRVGVDPSVNTLPPGENGDGSPARARANEDAGKEAFAAIQVLAHTEAQVAPIGAQHSLVDLVPSYKKPEPATRKSVEQAVHPAKAPSGITARGGAPGPNAPSADPAPLTDSESDAFAKTGSVEVSEGNVEAKLGRKVKTIRPKLSLAAQLDLVGMQYPRMKLRVRLDDAGKVAKLDVVKSTGSTTADQEVKIAVYQWEFGPDPKGKPKGPDVVEFEIIWR
jgi:TonB family protein